MKQSRFTCWSVRLLALIAGLGLTTETVRAAVFTTNAAGDSLLFSPGSVAGLYTTLEVTGSGWGYTSRTIVKFDVSTLTNGISGQLNINSIQMQLRTSHVSAAGAAPADRILTFHQVTQAWNEATVTWWWPEGGVGPGWVLGGVYDPTTIATCDWSGLPDSVQAVNASDLPLTVDILPGSGNQEARNSLVTMWLNGTNYGFLFKNNNETASAMLGLRARENAPGPGPALVIDYTVVSPRKRGTVVLIR